MFEVQVLIPTFDNNSRQFVSSEFKAFEVVLLNAFGGFSLYPSEVTGAWTNGTQVFNDKNRVYSVAVSSITEGEKVKSVVAFAKTHFAQEAIFIR